ncbi:MAG: cytochrome P450 [Novosphingobium sp.]|nr:cytochrome P450 [Novosphingobium sp.]
MATVTAPRIAPQPDHVPDELVYDYDMYNDAALNENAPDRLVDIATNAPPVFWTPHNGGMWFVTRFRLVTEAGRNWENFSSEPFTPEDMAAMMAQLPPDEQIYLPVPILLDPPVHTGFRKPLNLVFAPKAMMAMQDDIRSLAAELIEGVKDAGHCEFMEAIGEPMPVQVFLGMFGLPLERQDEFRQIVSDHLSEDFGEHADSQRQLRAMAKLMESTLLERRENPTGDLISRLWQTDVDGRALTLEDMQNYCILLFIAGLDTVMNAMGFGVRHLAANPALQAELRADPALIPEAAEELLRRYSFVVSTRRAARDMSFGGAQIKAGERVMLYNPAANVDPDEFPDPGTFDLHRENKAHVTFASGPHRCLGSHLARIEVQTLYEEMLARLPEFRLDPDNPVSYRCGPVIGPRAVPIRWDT